MSGVVIIIAPAPQTTLARYSLLLFGFISIFEGRAEAVTASSHRSTGFSRDTWSHLSRWNHTSHGVHHSLPLQKLHQAAHWPTDPCSRMRGHAGERLAVCSLKMTFPTGTSRRLSHRNIKHRQILPSLPRHLTAQSLLVFHRPRHTFLLLLCQSYQPMLPLWSQKEISTQNRVKTAEIKTTVSEENAS